MRIIFTALIREEAEGRYSVLYPEFGVASPGETIEEAKKNIVEAVELYIESAKEVIKALGKDGFRIIRRKGSHIPLYKKSDDKLYLVVVPDKKEVKRGTLFGILKQVGID